MVAVINDPMMEEMLIKERREKGLDKFDEVWEGVYMMSPIANIEHQWLTGKLNSILEQHCEPGTIVFPGVNVSDRENWTQNYRVPDVAVFLKGNPAEDRETFMLGGPDLAIEILSPGDRAFEKLDFYASVKTREVMVIGRYPWQIDLFRLDGQELKHAGKITPGDPAVLETRVVGLNWKLLPGEKRAGIEVSSLERVWNL
jgi:Uma2 family endonuclease